jgi:hypothetical protein
MEELVSLMQCKHERLVHTCIKLWEYFLDVLKCYFVVNMSWDSIVDIVTSYMLDNRSRSSSPGRVKNFLHVAQTGSEAHPASYPVAGGGGGVHVVSAFCIVIYFLPDILYTLICFISSPWIIIHGIGQVKYYTVTHYHEKIKILAIVVIVLI